MENCRFEFERELVVEKRSKSKVIWIVVVVNLPERQDATTSAATTFASGWETGKIEIETSFLTVWSEIDKNFCSEF